MTRACILCDGEGTNFLTMKKTLHLLLFCSSIVRFVKLPLMENSTFCFPLKAHQKDK